MDASVGILLCESSELPLHGWRTAVSDIAESSALDAGGRIEERTS
jgi:hypothetical protein